MRKTLGTKHKLGVAMVSGAILLMGVLSGCNNLHSAESLVVDAKKYHEKGDDKAAIIQLKNALQKNADDAEARLLLGQIYNDTGDALSAEKEARKAMSLGLDSTRTLPVLGNALLSQGQYQNVIDELGNAKVADPAILTLRANAYLALNNRQAATDGFNEALKAKADYPEALIGLAKLALADRNVEEASRIAAQATQANPRNIESWFFKGDVHRIQGQAAEALAAYDKVLEIRSGHPQAYTQKAFIEIGQKKYAEARANIDAAKKAAPSAIIVMYADALLNFSEAKHAAANETLLRVLQRAPEYMPAILLSGANQLALGSTQQAEHQLKTYVDKDPNNLYARKLLASALLRNGQTERALALINAALKTAPDDAQLVALAGEASMKAKDYTRATEYYEKAATLSPKAASIHTALAVSRLAQGDDRRAIAELETAADLDGKSATAGVMLVSTHVRMKNFDQALAVAQELEKDHPGNPLIPNLKGGIYMEKKDYSAARASFDKALSLQPTYVPAAVNLARLDMQDNKPADAKKRFEHIVEKDKKNFQAMAALAAMSLKDGKKEEATSWLEKAVKENPNELRPSVMLAAHYLQLGNKEKALTIAQNLQALNPTSTEVLEFLAQAQVAAEKRDAAIDTYKKLAVLLPASGTPHLRVATQYMAMNNEAAAAESLKKALVLQPDYLDAQLAQAMLDMKNKRYGDALKMAKQIQTQNAKSPIGFALEGDVLLAQSQPALAVKAYDQAYARGKSAPLLLKVHESLTKSGNEKEASARVNQWAKDNPKDVQVLLVLGSQNLANKQTKTAIGQFENVIRLQPKNAVALNNLAIALHEEKDARALQYAQQAHELAPKSAAIADTLGWILVERNDVARGLPLLKEAATTEPKSAEIRYHYAVALMKSGDKTSARKELEQVLASGQKFPKLDEAQSLLNSL